MKSSSVRTVEEFDYHDFHLRGYTVSDFGRSLSLDLISGGDPQRLTELNFFGVASYRIVHTGGAIITYILEMPFLDAIKETDFDFIEDFRKHGGLRVYFDSIEEYGAYFANEGLKTWLILSAIGFEGLVVGRSLTDKAQAEQVGGADADESV